LSQLTAVEMPQQTLRYGYDSAGRLSALLDSIKPEQTTRWAIDPAGNRLPGKPQNQQQQQDHWAEQVHRNWREQAFNLLGHGQAMPQQPGPIDHWSDNRIGFNESSAWQYDAQGNRVEQVGQDGTEGYCRQQLLYDGMTQLTADKLMAQGNVAF
jgi:YD repeat-containing protein